MAYIGNIAKSLIVTFLVVIFCYPTPALAQTFEVESSSLNARSGPGTNYSRQGRLTKGEKLTELERVGSWSRVQTEDGNTVWVHNNYIKVAETGALLPANSERTTEPVRVRLQVNSGHTDFIESIDFNESRTKMVTRSRDSVIAVWDVQSGKMVDSWAAGNADSNGLYQMAWFANSGVDIISADEVGVQVWDAATGELKSYTSFDEDYCELHGISGSGEFALVLCGLPLIIVNTKLQKVISKTYYLSPNSVETATIDNTGQHLFISQGSKIVQSVVATGRIVKEFAPGLGEIREIVLTKDGKHIAAQDFDGDIAVLDLSNGGLIASFEVEGFFDTFNSANAEEIAVSIEKNLIAFLNHDRGAVIAELDTGKVLHSYEADFGVEFNLDRGEFIYAHNENDRNGVDFKKIDTGENVKTIVGDAEMFTSSDISKDGTYFAANTQSSRLVKFDLKSGKVVRRLPGFSRFRSDIEFANSDDSFISNSSNRAEYPFPTPHFIESGSSDESEAIGVSFGGGDTNDIAVSEENSTFAISRRGELALYDIQSRTLLKKIVTESFVDEPEEMTFSPDGEYFAYNDRRAGGASVKTADLKTQILQGIWPVERIESVSAYNLVSALAFSADSQKLAIGNIIGKLRIFNISDHSLSEEIDTNPNRKDDFQFTAVKHIAFDPTKERLVTGGEIGNLSIWDIQSGKLVLELLGSKNEILAVSYTDSGKAVVAGSQDGFIRKWDAETGRLLVSIFSPKGDDWVAITPEGFFSGTDSAINSIYLVNGLDILDLERFYDALYRPDLVLEALRGDPDNKVENAGKKLDLAKIWDSGLPPKLVDVASTQGDDVDLDKIDIIAEFESKSGGIGRVEIRVNGSTQLVKNIPDDGPNVKISQSVFITPGENQIEVVAYNKANLIASDRKTITVRSSAVPQDKPTLHVLAVGVNEYQDDQIVQLNYAVNDAEAIGSALKLAGSSIYENIEITTVLNAGASYGNLDRVFAEIGTKARPEDVFVFFLAGHGKTHEGRYYFIPPDFEYINDSSFAKNGIGQLQWQDWLARIPAQKSILLYDTCESGSLVRDSENEGLELTAAIDRLTRATGRTIITAATDTEPALEGYGGHGLFSYLVLEAIGVADKDKDGQLEVTEIIDYVKTELPEVSYEIFNHRQVPQASISGYSFSLGQPIITLQ